MSKVQLLTVAFPPYPASAPTCHCDVMRLGRGDAFSAGGGLLLLHPGEEASLAL